MLHWPIDHINKVHPFFYLLGIHNVIWHEIQIESLGSYFANIFQSCNAEWLLWFIKGNLKKIFIKYPILL